MNATRFFFVCLVCIIGVFGAQPPRVEQPRPEQPQPPVTPPITQPVPGVPQQPQPQPQPQQPSSEGQGKSIKELTETFIQNCKNKDKDALSKCMTDRTIIHSSSVLPFGGKYRGQVGFLTAWNRFEQFMDIKSVDANVVFADDRTGLSMLRTVTTGTLKRPETVAQPGAQPGQPQPPHSPPRNQQPQPQPQPQPPQPQPQPQPQPSQGQVELRGQLIIEWFGDGKICRMGFMALNDMEVLEQSLTKSQLVLHKILPVLMQQKDKELDLSQLKQYVAEDIVFKLHNVGPSQLVPKTEFKGLDEITAAVKACISKAKESKCAATDLENFCSGTFKVLHSDDISTVLLFVEGRATYMPRYQTISFNLNPQGQLARVEVVRSHPLYPWQIGSSDIQQPQPPQPRS